MGYSWDNADEWANTFSEKKAEKQTEVAVIRDPGKRLLNANRASQLLLQPIKYDWAWNHYQSAISNFWTFGEINFAYDISQVKKMSGEDFELLRKVVEYFAVQEILIQDEVVLGLYRHITNPEVRMFLLAQAQIEAIHAETYAGFIELLGLDPQKAYYAYQDDPFIKEKTDWADSHLQSMTDPHLKMNNLESIVSFMLDIAAFSLVEGIHFFGSFAILLNFRRRNILQGISEAVNFIRRDEDQHCKFAADLYMALLNENEDCQDERQYMSQHIRNFCIECVDLEKRFLRNILPKGTLGLTYPQLENYIEFLADKRMDSFGIGPIYGVEYNPLGWLSTYEVTSEHNFFEKSSTVNYQRGGLK